MYIHRIILRDVRNFEKLDYTFTSRWTQKPLDSVLLTGPNGSGKTTILRVIAALWENFSGWLRLRKALNSTQQAQKGLLLDAGLAAIEIRGLHDSSIWLFVASNPSYREILQGFVGENDKLIGEVRGGRGRPPFEPERLDAWLTELGEEKKRLEIGVDNANMLPNLLFLDAEGRTIKPLSIKQGYGEVYPETIYRWLVSYEAQERLQGHIESMFQNVKLRDPKQFEAIRNNVNQFLGENKSITDFDDNLRLPVRVGKKRPAVIHYLDELSAGERQCVIMMFMVSRWLMPGGVVLIDEPDLHLHVSLQRHFIHELEKVVHSKGGQLIITSHSETIWEEFSDDQSIDLVHGVMADVE